MGDEPNLPVLVSAEEVARMNRLNTLVIASSAQYTHAVDGLTFLQAVLKANEKARKELVGPLNEQVKKVNAAFKRLNEPFEAAELHLKTKMLDWNDRETKRIAEEQARIILENAERDRLAREEQARLQAEAQTKAKAEAVQAGLTEKEASEWARSAAEGIPVVAPLVEPIPMDRPTTMRGMLGSATVRTTWDFEVQDEFGVPRAYLSVDEGKIRQAIRVGIRDIPGVRIFEKQSMAGGRKGTGISFQPGAKQYEY